MTERFELVQKALLAMLEDKKYATLRDILITMNPSDVAGLFIILFYWTAPEAASFSLTIWVLVGTIFLLPKIRFRMGGTTMDAGSSGNIPDRSSFLPALLAGP